MKVVRLCAATLLLAGCPHPGAEEPVQDIDQERWKNPYELTPEEHELATGLAERSIEERGLRTEGPMYLAAAQVQRNKEAELEGAEDRYALVIHYRYDGDLSILTHIDLSGRRILEVETIEHYPAPLSEAEFEIARALALADPAVKDALSPHGDRIEVGAHVMRTADPEDPMYARRIVRLVFKTPLGYLSEPIVIVDLGAERVSFGSVADDR